MLHHICDVSVTKTRVDQSELLNVVVQIDSLSICLMATQKSCEHITNFFLRLMRMRFLANSNVAEVKLIRS